MSVDNNVIGEIFMQMMLEIARSVDRLGTGAALKLECNDDHARDIDANVICYPSRDMHHHECIIHNHMPHELIRIDHQPKNQPESLKESELSIDHITQHVDMNYHDAVLGLFELVGDVYPCIYCRNHYRQNAIPLLELSRYSETNPFPTPMVSFVHQFKTKINASSQKKNLDHITLAARSLVFTEWCSASKLWDMLIMIALSMPSTYDQHVDRDLSSFYGQNSEKYVRETSKFRWDAFYQFVELLALIIQTRQIHHWYDIGAYIWPLPENPNHVARFLVERQYFWSNAYNLGLRDSLLHRHADHSWYNSYKHIEPYAKGRFTWLNTRSIQGSIYPFNKKDFENYVDTTLKLYEIPISHVISDDFFKHI